jgi:YHS domain-containing protein
MNRTLKGLTLAAVAAFVLVLAVSALQTQGPDTAKDPVCGMSVKIATAKYTSEYKGGMYFFCSEGCKTSFDKEPEKYLAKKDGAMAGGMGGGMMMHNKAAAQTPDTAKDPVCGMSVKISTAKYISDYKGSKYYFCSEGCKTSFDKEPEKYLAALPTAKDPVCGMDVKKDGAPFTYEYKGAKYYFCCDNCKTEFSKNPEKYLDKKYVPKPHEQKPDGASCKCAGCAIKK